MSDVEWDGIPNCRSSISKGFTTDSRVGERDIWEIMRCRSESSRRGVEVDEGCEVCRRTSLKYTVCYSSNFEMNALLHGEPMKIGMKMGSQS